MPTSEKAITRRIKSALEERGFYVVKIHGGPYQAAGLPDLLAIKEGSASWVEVKRPGGRLTPLQEARHKELREAGCRVVVATCPEEAAL